MYRHVEESAHPRCTKATMKCGVVFQVACQRIRLRFAFDQPCAKFFHLLPIPKLDSRAHNDVDNVDILAFAIQLYVLQQEVGFISISAEVLQMPDGVIGLDNLNRMFRRLHV